MIKNKDISLVDGNVLYTFIKYGGIDADQESTAGMADLGVVCATEKHERVNVNRYCTDQDDLTAAFVSCLLAPVIFH